VQIILPKLGLTMTHGTITEWLKAPGDPVAADEPLCTYETEKVTLELTSPRAGVLSEILTPAGETAPVGTPVCVVLSPDEGELPASAVRSESSAATAREVTSRPLSDSNAASDPHMTATPRARALARERGVDLHAVAGRGPGGRIHAADVPDATPTAVPGAARDGGIKATPLARRIAAAHDLDLASINGTGPDGLIVREDVEAASRPSAPVVPSPDLDVSETVVPLTGVRRVIGDRMSQSAFSAPHVTLMTEAEATNLVSARAQVNEELAAGEASGVKISFNTLLVALAARALREHPYLNARLDADGIHLLGDINIALAVDTERGLMTPVLRDVNRLALAEIQHGYDAVIARALAGASLPEDYEGATFTITNLGSLDIDGFTPIINPPQAAILGVGRIVEKPVARDGAMVIRPMVTLSLSFDHRIVDGAPAARFLQRIKQLVERPMALLIGG
jgi:pyruvate dehydrogenase E2 component (dihydrolipoamide acetyltransferase)